MPESAPTGRKRAARTGGAAASRRRRAKTRRDLVFAFGAQGAFKVGGYVILALLARNLPREAFGQFLYLTALATLLVLFTELGTSNHLIRTTAQDPPRAASAYADVVLTRIPLVVLMVLGMGAFVRVTQPTLFWAAVVIAASAGLKDLNRSSTAVLYGLRQVTSAQFLFGGGLLFAVLLILLAVHNGADLHEVVLVYLAWGAALFLGGLAVVRWRVGPSPWRRARPRLRQLIGVSLPLFAVDLLALVHFKVDTVMLGLLRPMSNVAAYESAARLLEASQFLVRPLTVVFFPLLASMVWEGHDMRGIRRVILRLVGIVTLVGVAMAVSVGILASWIVPAVFGPGFATSVPLLRILFLSVPGLYVAVVAMFSGNALHVERATVRMLAWAVALNVGLNLAAIPAYGPTGAAWATVVSQGALAIALVLTVMRPAAHGSPRAPEPALRREEGLA